MILLYILLFFLLLPFLILYFLRIFIPLYFKRKAKEYRKDINDASGFENENELDDEVQFNSEKGGELTEFEEICEEHDLLNNTNDIKDEDNCKHKTSD